MVQEELHGDELTDQTSEVSWEPGRELTYDEWYRVGKTLHAISRAIGWWWGDFLAWGEMAFGESYTQIIEETEYSRETLKKFKAVSTRIPKGRRIPRLSWSHHFSVAYLEPAIADKILRLADEFSLSVRETKEIAAWPHERVNQLCEYADTHEQLHYPELMAKARMLELPGQNGQIEDDDIPFAMPVENNEQEENFWLDEDASDPMDSIKAFFASRGLPILYSDETTVVWEGGIRLYVARGEHDAYLTWEKSV